MELVKHAIDFSQRDVEGAVECDLYKVGLWWCSSGHVALSHSPPPVSHVHTAVAPALLAVSPRSSSSRSRAASILARWMLHLIQEAAVAHYVHADPAEPSASRSNSVHA